MSLRYLSQNQLSEITGKDRRTVKKRLEKLEPVSSDGRGSLYDAQEAIPLIFESSRSETEELLLEQQLRHERAKADKVSLEVQKRRGLLVEVEKIAATVAKEYTAARASYLALGKRVAHELAIIDNPVQIKTVIDNEVNEILKEFQADAMFALKQRELEVQRENQNDSRKLGNESAPNEDTDTEAASEDQPS